MTTPKILALIPARGGSKRIPNKNIRDFLGKPLLAYTIEQAQQSKLFDRIIVDTDSEKIAAVAKHYGAEAPFLRPPELASDTAMVIDAIIHVLDRLKNEQQYDPDYVVLLQTTSPLRELKDIDACWELMQHSDATTVLTVCPTHPRLYYMDENKNIILANGSESQSTNMQAWRPAYILNGCFVYIIKTQALREEHRVITKNTKAVVCERWRSVDLDNLEDWAMAELIYKHRLAVSNRLKELK